MIFTAKCRPKTWFSKVHNLCSSNWDVNNEYLMEFHRGLMWNFQNRQQVMHIRKHTIVSIAECWLAIWSWAPSLKRTLLRNFFSFEIENAIIWPYLSQSNQILLLWIFTTSSASYNLFENCNETSVSKAHNINYCMYHTTVSLDLVFQ